MLLRGKNVLITGGAKRIGSAVARELARRRCNIAFTYLKSRKEAGELLKSLGAYGVDVVSVRADISKISEVRRLHATLKRRWGGIDILVNNASVFEPAPWPKISEKDWDEHLDVNLKGTFFCSQIFGADMQKKKEGKIINFVDSSAERPWTGYLPYSLSKAGVLHLTKALSRILAPHVHVHALSLGPILTPNSKKKDNRKKIERTTLLGRFGSLEDVTNAVLYLLEQGDYSTGNVHYVDGGSALR